MKLKGVTDEVDLHFLFRPVRLRMGFHDNMKSVGKRFPFLADYEVGELDKIQTHERFQTTLFIRTQHSMQKTGGNPSFKLQNNT